MSFYRTGMPKRGPGRVAAIATALQHLLRYDAMEATHLIELPQRVQGRRPRLYRNRGSPAAPALLSSHTLVWRSANGLPLG